MALVMDSALESLVERVKAATRHGTPLVIHGGNTKSFYGEAVVGEPLDVRELRGISSYEPTELVVTARAGTTLQELEAALAERGQHLAFEPPRFGDASAATVGGMVAAGLAGPARMSTGSVRDFVLGATLLNGRGDVLTFGGQVMKNVAGYDVARVLAGSLGILGVICEVSLKVLPIPVASSTRIFEIDELRAFEKLRSWASLPLPINATAWYRNRLFVRLSGASAAVRAATDRLGGDSMDDTAAFKLWHDLRDHRFEFFEANSTALWRISVPPTSDPLPLQGRQLIEWGGGLRWWRTETAAPQVRALATQSGGHATLFYARDKSPGVFAPLSAPLDRIHHELKRRFDPERIFNRGRMYKEL